MKRSPTLTGTIFFLCLLLGFLYRLYLSSLATTNILYDMASYSTMAEEIVSGRLTADCCDHNTGYSIFVAAIYALFGVGNLTAVRVAHCFVEILTAVLIYQTATALFTRRSAWFAFLLYLLNPFTASYTGLLLSEVVTLCVTAWIIFVVSRKQITHNPHWWFSLGLALGTMLLIRASAPPLVYAFFLYFFWYLKRTNRWRFLLVACCGFIIPSSYSLITNYQHFHTLSLTPPYSMGSAILYLNFYNDKQPELLDHYFDQVNPEFYRILLDFHRLHYTSVPSFRQYYDRLFWQRIPHEWPLFAYNTLRNIVWLWDKNHLFFYTDPFYPHDTLPLQIINLISLALFLGGVGIFIRSAGWKSVRSPVLVFTVFFFLIITGLYSLVSNETRHSLPFYVLVYLWAGYALDHLTKKISRTTSPKTTPLTATDSTQ